MKKILFTACILFFPFVLFAQSTSIRRSRYLQQMIHIPGDVGVSISGNRLNNIPYSPLLAGGCKMRFFVTKRLSMDADLIIGKDYFHYGLGVIGLPMLLLSSDFDSGPAFGLYGLIFMIASTEHFAYHIPLKSTTDISPFVSLLRAKNFKTEDINSDNEIVDSHFSFATGIEINKYFKRFVFSPYIEYNKAYDGSVRGFNFGVNMGYYFPNHKW